MARIKASKKRTTEQVEADEQQAAKDKRAKASAQFVHGLFGLDGLTAVVIGGEGVLGGAIAEGLANAGAHAVVAGINQENGDACVERISQAGGTAEFFKLDATKREDLEALVKHISESKRRCDILVNAAGINAATPFLEISDDEWDRILNVNLRSVRLACQVFGKAMLDAGNGGSIINIASASSETPLSRVFTYSVTKAGVLNLTRNLAREWAEQGIRVNALSPGFFPAEQ
ncbi:SDR family NAD(P)-dependent oxidoreductase, partial [Candidatus Peribacteria bacterium]|nr:SDR family NAD(P)-dependent oxidoreductase [Candidatus Peribacteria bacterium]